MAEKQEIYLGNPNLKRANVNTSFSPEEVQKFIKCSQDPVYFIRNYIKIVNLDEGIVNFDLYDFQEDMVNRFHEHRFNIAKLPRQSGKSTVVTAYLLWYAIFNDNVNIAILANKAATAREMLGRLQLSYENLPKWLQQGVVNWNRGSLELERRRLFIRRTCSILLLGWKYLASSRFRNYQCDYKRSIWCSSMYE